MLYVIPNSRTIITVFPAMYPALIQFSGRNILRSAINTFQLHLRESVQAVSCLRNYTYVYGFGRAPGEVEIQGLILPDPCEVQSVSTWAATWNRSLFSAIAFFETQRFSSRGEPIAVAVGNVIFQAVLDDMKIRYESAGGFHMPLFMLHALVIP